MSINTVMKKMSNFTPWQRAQMRRPVKVEVRLSVDRRAACRVAISALSHDHAQDPDHDSGGGLDRWQVAEGLVMAYERDLAHERDLELRRREQLRADFGPDNGNGNGNDPGKVTDPDGDEWPDTGWDDDGDDL